MRAAKFPVYSALTLIMTTALCIAVPFFTGSATRMDGDALSMPPSDAHFFGTDPLGRDLFNMICHGGRVSLYIGALATVLSTLIAIVYGAAAGLAGRAADAVLMRFIELLLSIPSILYVVTIQAIIGKPSATSIALVIGLTSWMTVAKMVRTEALRVRRVEYVLSAQHMGGAFFYVARRHLLPNFFPAILFMVVSNIGGAISTEATLSFMGIGLPTTVVSWGSLMSLSQDALLTNSWWIILIPGIFLVSTLVCVANIGEYFRVINSLHE
ncbi:MAG: ABC transporter permease [Synergistaceae bacterium]|nr:ABC transporter permease [Synergistaceae bacterium]